MCGRMVEFILYANDRAGAARCVCREHLMEAIRPGIRLILPVEGLAAHTCDAQASPVGVNQRPLSVSGRWGWNGDLILDWDLAGEGSGQLKLTRQYLGEPDQVVVDGEGMSDAFLAEVFRAFLFTTYRTGARHG